ncbi:ribonuclease III domain-containing protein [Methanococcoides sp. AM1]|uniref:ribonuclease III domain-containing protein n=1 Tax=Methanococcoides sp. AM1 TaxID=1201011 RepID=UPI001083F1DD|nr:ribonuclease III domain-containing protein [Methanococcoides sp. AM1]
MTGNIEEILGYHFSNKELLIQALTTRAYSNEHLCKDQNEFRTVGDVVIKLALTEMLMGSGKRSGGTITPARIKLEKKKGLSNAARKLKIEPFLRLGKGQIIQNHGNSDHVLAETLEAIAGAIFLDAGFDKPKDAIRKWFIDEGI